MLIAQWAHMLEHLNKNLSIAKMLEKKTKIYTERKANISFILFTKVDVTNIMLDNYNLCNLTYGFVVSTKRVQ